MKLSFSKIVKKIFGGPKELKEDTAFTDLAPINTKTAPQERAKVLKTYKLFIKGEFPRSESGRSFPIASPTGELLAHASRASRKDLRTAVEAAHGAQPSWASKTAYNRGQILYRVAEIMETRSDSFAAELVSTSGKSLEDSKTEVAATIDSWVWYAGWADKFSSVLGGSNPVSGPYFNFTTPEPIGVVGIIIGSSLNNDGPNNANPLLPLVSRLAPALVSGNSVILLAPEDAPLSAISLGEALATSDIPGGVVNILTGSIEELAPHFLSHTNIGAVDITEWASPETSTLELAADSIKRVIKAQPGEQSPYAIADFCEMKTVWHPIGR